jgi:hypothetical protein
MAPWKDYAPVYKSILRQIKDKGIRVFHRSIRHGAGGLFDQNQCIITIDKTYKNTLYGCFVLCHELIHFEQSRINEFPGFFEISGEFTQEKLDLIIAAEVDADKKASKMLKMWGINYEPLSFTKVGLEENIKFWKKYYFG